MAGRSGIGVLVTGFSRVGALKKHAPLVFNPNPDWMTINMTKTKWSAQNFSIFKSCIVNRARIIQRPSRPLPAPFGVWPWCQDHCQPWGHSVPLIGLGAFLLLCPVALVPATNKNSKSSPGCQPGFKGRVYPPTISKPEFCIFFYYFKHEYVGLSYHYQHINNSPQANFFCIIW